MFSKKRKLGIEIGIKLFKYCISIFVYSRKINKIHSFKIIRFHRHAILVSNYNRNDMNVHGYIKIYKIT